MNSPPLLISLLLLLLSGCSEPVAESAVEPEALVSVATAQTTDLAVVIRGYGNAEFNPSSRHTLNAEIEARLLALEVSAGDMVAQNQVIGRLAPSSASGTEVDRARRDADTARAASERVRRLRADGLASDAELELANTAARDLIELAVSLEARAGNVLTLRAPYSAVVDGILAEPGDLITPGTPIVRLASPEALQARIGVEVEDAPQLRAGAPVSLSSLDNSDTRVATVVRLVDTRVDPTTRMASALIDIPPGQHFFAGEALRAEFTVGMHTGAVVVPRSAVFHDETGAYVFMARDGTAVLQRIKIGLTSGEQTEVLAGITTGNSIVVEGAATAADGMKIRFAKAGTTRE